MRKVVQRGLGLALVGSLLVATPMALAATTATTPKSSATVKTTIKDRVTQYKLDHVITLTAPEQTRLKTVCKAGQIKITALDTKVASRNNLRVAAYKEITNQLTAIIPRIKAAGAPSTLLVDEQTQLATLITTYNTSLATYQTALQDTAALDCQTDPSAFRSALESARADQIAVNTNALAIRTYLTGTLKASLQASATTITTSSAASTNGGIQ